MFEPLVLSTFRSREVHASRAATSLVAPSEPARIRRTEPAERFEVSEASMRCSSRRNPRGGPGPDCFTST